MSQAHEVISAFLDDEAFDAAELAAALSRPDGRDVLIELVALRHLVQLDVKASQVFDHQPRRGVVRALAAAALIVVALAAGYLIGERRTTGLAVGDPPPPARIVDAATEWQPVAPGELP